MFVDVIETGDAPQAIGPYSQAIRAGGFLFLSGQLPLDPKTGKTAEGIAAQTRQALVNIQAILKSQGLEFNSVVKIGVFLKDLNDFQEMNRIYGEILHPNKPARTTIQAARLPLDVLVEIDAIVVH